MALVWLLFTASKSQILAYKQGNKFAKHSQISRVKNRPIAAVFDDCFAGSKNTNFMFLSSQALTRILQVIWWLSCLLCVTPLVLVLTVTSSDCLRFCSSQQKWSQIILSLLLLRTKWILFVWCFLQKILGASQIVRLGTSSTYVLVHPTIKVKHLKCAIRILSVHFKRPKNTVWNRKQQKLNGCHFAYVERALQQVNSGHCWIRSRGNCFKKKE